METDKNIKNTQTQMRNSCDVNLGLRVCRMFLVQIFSYFESFFVGFETAQNRYTHYCNTNLQFVDTLL